MKFAVNYSTDLSKLILEDNLAIDLIKCPDWDGIIIEARKLLPVYVHFDILVGIGKVKNLKWDKIHHLMELTNTEHINCHLVANSDIDPILKSDQLKLLKIWEEEINLLSTKFSNKNIVAEHFPFMPYHPHMRQAVDAGNISRIVKETGCRFLLDLAHARITALVLGLDERTYALALPIDRLSELHITGIKEYNGYLVDHFEMQPADWKYTEWALKMIKTAQWPEPKLVAFEYGGVGSTFAWRTDKAVLKEQVPQLAQLIKSSSPLV